MLFILKSDREMYSIGCQRKQSQEFRRYNFPVQDKDLSTDMAFAVWSETDYYQVNRTDYPFVYVKPHLKTMTVLKKSYRRIGDV